MQHARPLRIYFSLLFRVAKVGEADDTGYEAVIEDEKNTAALGIVGPVSLAQRFGALFAGGEKLDVNMVVLHCGRGCVENGAGVGIDDQFLRAENATDFVLGEVEPKHLADSEILGIGANDLEFHRCDFVREIAGDEQVKVRDGGIEFYFRRVWWNSWRFAGFRQRSGFGQHCEGEITGDDFVGGGKAHAGEFNLLGGCAVKEVKFFRSIGRPVEK